MNNILKRMTIVAGIVAATVSALGPVTWLPPMRPRL